MDPALRRASKFLSLVLRHDPARVGLALDGGGWVAVDDLLSAMTGAGLALDRATLERIVAENEKQRFAFDADGTRIRANQGHSIPVDLGLVPAVPPAELYHGTAHRFVADIRGAGLLPGARTHVHLSADVATARQVGGRHGRPVVLRVAAAEMHDAGHQFWQAANGVWLAVHVPAEYLTIPAE